MSDFRFSSVPKEDLLHDVSRQDYIDDWDEYFLGLAFFAARKSKDPSTKTGCAVARDNRLLTTGYNGFPMGMPDDEHLYADREYKYANIAHCDSNAVFSAAFQGVSLKGATMYLTGPPCTKCTQAIIQAGITKVVWPTLNKFECDPETGKRWEGDATGTDAQALINLSNAGIVYERFSNS